VDALRLLTAQQLRARAATMLERLGYELLYPDKAKRLGSALQNAAKSTTRKPRSRAAKP